jgi:HEAT repeat protein
VRAQPNPRRLVGAAAWLTATCALAAVAAAEPAPVILYSYTRVVVGNDAQYVLAPTAGSLKVEPGAPLSPAIVNGAFQELRARKSATYGDSSVDASPASLAKGTVTVKIDPSKDKYASIIISETVYTLTQLGLESVSFPNFEKKPVRRQDVSVGAFALKMPAWRALPPRKIAPAIILLPDGAEMDAAAFYQKLASGDEAMIALLKGYLASEDEPVVSAAVRALAELKLPNRVELLLPLLRANTPAVRLAGLEALVGQEDAAALDAISAVMDKDKDKAVAQRAAQILGQSKNKLYSVRAQFFVLRNGDEPARLEAIKALGASKEPTAAPELVKAARGDNQPVALAATDALVDLDQAAEVERLFADEKLDKERRLRASTGALRLADPRVRFGAISYLARVAPASTALSALDSLGKTADPDPRPSIEGALTHPEANVRHAAAKLLAGRKNPASLKPLAAAGARAEDEEVMEEAASLIMGELALTDVLGYTSQKDVVLQRVAYRALGQKASGASGPKVFDALKSGATNKDAGIRASSVLALGAFQNDKALELVSGAAADPEARVRRSAARALASWPAGIRLDLLNTLLDDKSGDVVQSAIEALDQRDERDTYKKILSIFRNKPEHPGVRAASLKAIVKLAPEKELQTVISTVGGGLFDKDHEVKVLSINLLGRYDNPAAVTTLAALINDPVEEYRVRSLLALGDTGSKEAIELIASVANDQSKPVRVAAMESLGRIGSKAAGDAIKQQMATEQDEDVLRAGREALKKIK